MPPIRLGPHDLLEYDARHGVLICRECQYAIQKSALESHLLKHKIYRDERQRLLSSIAQLELFEPDDVPLPTPDFPPIDTLPIISGYRCTAVGCGNLCASSKRMRRHQSEIHGFSDPRNISRPVKLQTFFRGTKLRYFEVTPLSWAGATGAAPLTTTKDDDDGYENENEKYGEELDEQMHDADMPPSRVRTPPEAPPKCSLVDLNLETLTYFHHFTTTTSLTLPSAESPQLATHYWQTDVVVQALGRRWLMCGLLAISACHLAVLADDATIERVHREQSVQFFLEFSNGWEEAANRDLSMEVEEEAKKAGGQMVCILRCAQWASAEYMLDQGIIPEPAAPSQLQSIMTTIRAFGVWSDDDNGQEQTFAQASRILNTRSASNAGSFGAFPSCDNTLSTLLNHLGTLPSRMAEALGKPENTQDVLATLSAIAALVECYVTSFASDEAGTVWRAMATWLIKVPSHFNHMVSRHSRAALVVLAHWAVLVERAEHCGCWFLRGSVRKILLRIAERLPADDFGLESGWKLNSINKII